MKNKIKKLKSENDLVDDFVEIEKVLRDKNEVIGINTPMLNIHTAIDNRNIST